MGFMLSSPSHSQPYCIPKEMDNIVASKWRMSWSKQEQIGTPQPLIPIAGFHVEVGHDLNRVDIWFCDGARKGSEACLRIFPIGGGESRKDKEFAEAKSSSFHKLHKVRDRKCRAHIGNKSLCVALA